MDEVGFLVADIYECAGLFRKQGELIAARVGQTQARWQVLSVVSAGGLTVPSIARRLGITRQSVQRVVNELAASHLVGFESNPDHRISPIVKLLPQGERVLKEITRAAQAMQEDVKTAINVEKIQEVRTDLQKLNAKLREIIDKS